MKPNDKNPFTLPIVVIIGGFAVLVLGGIFNSRVSPIFGFSLLTLGTLFSLLASLFGVLEVSRQKALQRVKDAASRLGAVTDEDRVSYDLETLNFGPVDPNLAKAVLKGLNAQHRAVNNALRSMGYDPVGFKKGNR